MSANFQLLLFLSLLLSARQQREYVISNIACTDVSKLWDFSAHLKRHISVPACLMSFHFTVTESPHSAAALSVRMATLFNRTPRQAVA